MNNEALKPRFVNKSIFDKPQPAVPELVKPPVIKAEASLKEGDSIFIPERITLIPYSTGQFRLGMEKTKEGFMRVPGTSYRWEPDIRGNVYRTGLQYISESRRRKLETELGRELNNEYYQEMTYVMDGSNPNGHKMDLTEPRDLVIYLAMLDSKLIARNKMQKGKGEKPEADWYIEDAEAEAEAFTAGAELFVEATMKYGEISFEKKAAIAKILRLPVRGISPKVANAKLWQKLSDTNAKDSQKTLKRFMDMVEWSDEKINIFAEVEDAVAYNIIRRNSAQDYCYGDDVLGSTLEQVQSKLLDGTNGGLRQAIKNKISLKQ